MIVIKSASEIELMRRAGQVVARVLLECEKMAKPGVKTIDLDRLAEDVIRKAAAQPSFKGYRPPGMTPFPGSICTSINEQVVHGIPGARRLEDGDILSIDVGACLGGFQGDASTTLAIGNNVPKESLRLLDVTREALFRGIGKALDGLRLGDLSSAIGSFVEENGFSVVRDYVGHGIGQRMHEDPEIPNYGLPGTGPLLREGMTLAIEPMVNAGAYATRMLDNGWTVVTQDGSRSAHFEHTVAITAQGPEILTML